MSLDDLTRALADAKLLLAPPCDRPAPKPPCSGKSTRQSRSAHASPRRRRAKQHRLRCDCGLLAIKVLQVRVGSDPQYTIRLPLCPACLKLEQELH